MSVTIGRVYDLQSLYERLNRLYFDGSLNLKVEWFPRAVSKAKRRILLGTYTETTKTVRLSRRLDQTQVPLFFVEHILFHEMLHAVFPRENHRMHTAKFKTYERLHPDFERAVEWEKNSKGLLFQRPQGSLPFNQAIV